MARRQLLATGAASTLVAFQPATAEPAMDKAILGRSPTAQCPPDGGAPQQPSLRHHRTLPSVRFGGRGVNPSVHFAGSHVQFVDTRPFRRTSPNATSPWNSLSLYCGNTACPRFADTSNDDASIDNQNDAQLKDTACDDSSDLRTILITTTVLGMTTIRRDFDETCLLRKD